MSDQYTNNTETAQEELEAQDRYSPARGLSVKLLLMTLLFVMIAEVLIFLPSVANYRDVWLRTHLESAEAASIVYLDSDRISLSEEGGANLLASIQAQTIAIRERGAPSRLMATMGMPGEIYEHINLDTSSAFSSIFSALGMLFADENRIYRVFGTMRSSTAKIELIQEVKYIQAALWIYARNVMFLSLLISLFTGALVYLALYRLIVLPIIRLSSNMNQFSKEPENSSLIFQPGRRRDEIGLAEKRLSALQGDLQKTLRQKKHLADLGLAVSKINHDLRNILASAQLFSDRLSTSPDPLVQRFVPKLIRTIDRAVEYTKSVIDYGRALEAPPKRRALWLRSLVDDVQDSLDLDNHPRIDWMNDVDESIQADADPEQLFRVLLNLSRNSVQAMGDIDDTERELLLTIVAERRNHNVHIWVRDTGPGISEHARDKLFQAFEGSTKAGGTGLGMTIASELVRAHGGTIDIETSSHEGTSFQIVIPDSPDENGQIKVAEDILMG